MYGDANMEATVDGAPLEFRMRAALAELGPSFRIEIIQPMDERGPYGDSLRRNGDADHRHPCASMSRNSPEPRMSSLRLTFRSG